MSKMNTKMLCMNSKKNYRTRAYVGEILTIDGKSYSKYDSEKF